MGNHSSFLKQPGLNINVSAVMMEDFTFRC